MAKKRIRPEAVSETDLGSPVRPPRRTATLEGIAASQESADDRLMPLLEALHKKVPKVTQRNVTVATKAAIKSSGGADKLLASLLAYVGKTQPAVAEDIQKRLMAGDLVGATEMANMAEVSKKGAAVVAASTDLKKAAGIGARGKGRPKKDTSGMVAPKAAAAAGPVVAPAAAAIRPGADINPAIRTALGQLGYNNEAIDAMSPEEAQQQIIKWAETHKKTLAAKAAAAAGPSLDPEVAPRAATPIDPSAEAPFASTGVPAAAAAQVKTPRSAASISAKAARAAQSKTGAVGTLLKYALGVENPSKPAMKTALMAGETKGAAMSQKLLGQYLKNPGKGNLLVGGAAALLPMLLMSMVGGAAGTAENLTGADLTAESQIDSRIKKLQSTDADTLIASLLAQQYRAKQARKAMNSDPNGMRMMQLQQQLASGQVPGDQPVGADALSGMGF